MRLTDSQWQELAELRKLPKIVQELATEFRLLRERLDNVPRVGNYAEEENDECTTTSENPSSIDHDNGDAELQSRAAAAGARWRMNLRTNPPRRPGRSRRPKQTAAPTAWPKKRSVGQ